MYQDFVWKLVGINLEGVCVKHDSIGLRDWVVYGGKANVGHPSIPYDAAEPLCLERGPLMS